jgi:hypothetical protein
VSEPVVPATPDETLSAEVCAQCLKTLGPGDRVSAGGRLFCSSCYASLRAELERVVTALSSDINYTNAAVGAVLGGAAGALAWWGFTVVTRISLGLVAIAIGYLTGLGAVRFAGGKRSTGLQALSITVALASYVVATYLVNMTFANQALAKQRDSFRVAFPPQSFGLFVRVLSLGFGVMNMVFLAIVVYEAWKIPKPLALPPDARA